MLLCAAGATGGCAQTEPAEEPRTAADVRELREVKGSLQMHDTFDERGSEHDPSPEDYYPR